MKKPKITYIKEYVQNLHYDVNNAPHCFFNGQDWAALNMTLNVTVKSVKSDGTLFCIELEGILYSFFEKEQVFEMKINYVSILRIEFEGEKDTEILMHILNVDEPKRLYESLREVVKNISTRSGFTIVELSDYDFSDNNNITNESVMIDEVSECKSTIPAYTKDNIFPLGYSFLIEDIMSEDGGSNFLEIFQKRLNTDISIYEDLPLYKYYYKFMNPISYNHPDYSECESSFWDFFIQLLFSEGEDVEIIDNGNNLPDIGFMYNKSKHIVSELSLGELKYLVSELGTEAMTNDAVMILKLNIDEEVYESLKNMTSIQMSDLYRLYKYAPETSDKETELLIEKIYLHIAYYQVQTMLFQMSAIGE